MSSTTSSLDSSSEECRSPFSGVPRPSMVGDTFAVQQTGSSDDNLFEACKNGDLKRVKDLVNSSNVNLQDTTGRRSTPLHFAAGTLLARTLLVLCTHVSKCCQSSHRYVSRQKKTACFTEPFQIMHNEIFFCFFCFFLKFA